jgi:hypothetical protein
MDDLLHTSGCQACHRIGVCAAARQQGERRRQIDHIERTFLVRPKAFAQAGRKWHVEHHTERRTPKVCIHQQHPALIRLAEGQREIGGGQCFSFRRLGTGDHDDLDVS